MTLSSCSMPNDHATQQLPIQVKSACLSVVAMKRTPDFQCNVSVSRVNRPGCFEPIARNGRGEPPTNISKFQAQTVCFV